MQRVARTLAVALLLAALVGAFGGGPLASAKREAPGLAVSYERIAYRDVVQRMRVVLDGSRTHEATWWWIDREAAREWRIERIVPTPQHSRVDSNRVWFEVAASPHGPTEILIDVRALESGRHPIGIGVEDGGSVRLAQWVLP